MLRFLGRVRRPPGASGRVDLRPHGRAIRDAYLGAWAVDEPVARLRTALDLAGRLRPLFQALHWYNERPYVRAASPWGRHVAEAVPAALRRLATTVVAPAGEEGGMREGPVPGGAGG
jgi:hypothetical protein